MMEYEQFNPLQYEAVQFTKIYSPTVHVAQSNTMQSNPIQRSTRSTKSSIEEEMRKDYSINSHQKYGSLRYVFEQQFLER
jgi:hypothetical protein